MSPSARVALAALSLAATWAQAQTAPAAAAADMTLARNLAATCASCHGTRGAARGEMKVLAGLPAEQITTMVAAFRSGALPATVMHQIAKGYSEAQITLIAAYFAAQPKP
jgi:sulfide dehydrogenase cytochrome subunit